MTFKGVIENHQRQQEKCFQKNHICQKQISMKLAVKNLIVYSFISNFIKKLELFDQLFDHGVFGETMLC